MRVVISACTTKAFSGGLIPLAHLKPREGKAMNDNDVQSPLALNSSPSKQAGGFFNLRPKRAAYGRSGLIIAVIALVAGIIAMPLLQGLSAPVMTVGDGRPEVLRGSPIAPALLQPQENG